MTYCKNYCEEKGISTSELSEAQKTLYYIAENMKMEKSISEEGYKHFQKAIKALEQEPCREADDYENEISDLYNRLDIAEYDKERLREEVTTLEEKLKGLSAEPCEDAISRAEVIDELNRIGRNAFKEDTDYDNFFAFLDNLPPVQPQTKTGHWFIDERPESDRETICSNCEQPIFKYHKLDFDYRPKYCPNCGAKMVELQESEE